MRREQKKAILADLQKKMVFLVGPRQVGKTWLAKEIAKEYSEPLYLNYDFLEDRRTIKTAGWLPPVDLIIFDELHKMPNWKNYIKGVYDTKNPLTHILVTGSARLETFRQTGDSLAGRFFVHHLLPISLKEMKGTQYENELDHLLERGGFPEPFLAESEIDAKKWRQEYTDSLLREDILDFRDIGKFKAMRDVFEIVRGKVGAPVSYTNIAQDVGVASSTVKRYLEILEALYIVYLVRPFSKKISRSILKEPKLYFYDTGLVRGDDGVVFENLVANALLKHAFGKRDMFGEGTSLMYIKNKEDKEVDFALTNSEGALLQLIEVKLSDHELSKNLKYFSERLNVPCVQVVKNIRYGTRIRTSLEIREAKEYLSALVL